MLKEATDLGAARGKEGAPRDAWDGLEARELGGATAQGGVGTKAPAGLPCCRGFIEHAPPVMQSMEICGQLWPGTLNRGAGD